jgi:methionyl-tRNA synthetase
MNPTDLINPKCKISGTTPIIRTTRHIFLDLPKLSSELQAYHDAASSKGGWSSNCVQVSGNRKEGKGQDRWMRAELGGPQGGGPWHDVGGALHG